MKKFIENKREKMKKIILYPKKCMITFFYAIIFFALLKPDSLEYLGFEWISNMLIALDGLIMLFLFFLLLTNKYKMSKMTILIIIYFIYLLIPTIMGTGEIFTWIKMAGPAIAICLLTDFILTNEKEYYFSAINFLLFSLYFLNFISICIYYPDGMYRMEKVVGDLYLMGYDNGMIYNLLPLCGISIILSYMKKGKMFSTISIFPIILTFASELLVQSASGIVEIMIFILLIFLLNTALCKKILKPKILFGCFFISSIAITIFRLQNTFSWLIVDILKKDLTFTNRTYIWDNALLLIKDNWLFGVGCGEKIVEGIFNRTYAHPHSMFLDLLLKGGIITMGIFVSILSNFCKKYNNSKETIIKNIILAVIVTFLVGEIVNSVQYKIFFWSFFVLIEYADKILEKS